MKKIIYLLCFLFAGFMSGSQTLSPTPGTVGRANSSVNVEDNKLFARQKFVAPRFSDTTQANTYGGAVDTCGALIYTQNVKGFWWRACLPTGKKWVRFGDISLVTFLTDSSIIICNGANICDTISMNNFSTVVTNIVQNFNDSSVFNINDSTLLICHGVGNARVCDTIHLGNSNTYYFLNDSTLVSCDTVIITCVGDSCYQTQLCDTTIIPGQTPIPGTFSQNWLWKLPGTQITEFGSEDPGQLSPQMIHDTYSWTNGYQWNISGRSLGRPIMGVQQSQWELVSSSISKWNHLGNYTAAFPGAIDNLNPVNLYFNYITPMIVGQGPPFTGDTVGFMYDRIGYAIMTNSQGDRASYSINSTLSKQTGVMLHTFDTDNTDAVTIFGNQVPSNYTFSLNPPVDSSLLDARIAVFKTSGQQQLPQYINDAFTNVAPVYGLGVDVDGNVVAFPPAGGGGPVTTVTLQNSLWVAKNGSDATGTRNRVDKPYLTIRAAVTAAQSGDVVVVIAGDYETASPIKIKDGVNFQFMGAGTVTLATSVSAGYVFDDSSSAVTSVIDAPGWKFTARSNQRAFNFGAASHITIYADEIISATGMTLRAGGGSVVTVHANKLYGNALAGAIWLDSCVAFYGTFDIIQVGVNGNAIWTENVADVDIRAKRIFAQPNNDDFLIHVAASNATDSLYFEADEIRAGTNWAIWAVGESPYVYLKAKIISAKSDCVVTSSLISGGALTVEAQMIADTETGSIDGVVNAEGGLVHVIGATIRNASAGPDLVTKTVTGDIGRMTLNAVVYDTTKVSEEDLAGTITRVDRDFWSGISGKFVQATTAPYVMVYGATGRELQILPFDSISAAITADNGLTASTATNVQLGGTGIQYTNIDWGAFSFTNTFNSIDSSGFIISSTSTAAVNDAQILVDINLSGTNANANQTTYALRAQNTHGGTGGVAGGAYIFGESTAILGESNGSAITGKSYSSGTGVAGYSLGSGIGVYGQGTTHGVYGASVSGIAVFGDGNGAEGVKGISISSYPGYLLKNFSATAGDATIQPILKLERVNTGASVGNGVGGSVEFYLEASDGASYLSNQIITKFPDVTVGSRTSQLDITGVYVANTNTMLRLGGRGDVELGDVGAINNSLKFTIDQAAKAIYIDSKGTGDAYMGDVLGGGSATFISIADASQLFTINANQIQLKPITATTASAIATGEGKIVFVSNTNGTFTSIGPWCYYNGAWHAL